MTNFNATFAHPALFINKHRAIALAEAAKRQGYGSSYEVDHRVVANQQGYAITMFDVHGYRRGTLNDDLVERIIDTAKRRPVSLPVTPQSRIAA